MAEYTADELGKHILPLQRLSEALQCRICAQFFTGPVQLRCGHSFCSNCIRGNLEFKLRNHGADAQTCPDCRQPADEASLVINYALREAVSAFKHLLPDLKNIIQTVIASPRKAAAPSASRPNSYHQATYPASNQHGRTVAPSVQGKLNESIHQFQLDKARQNHQQQCQVFADGGNPDHAADQATDQQNLAGTTVNDSKKRLQIHALTDNEVQILDDVVAMENHHKDQHPAKRLKPSNDQQAQQNHGNEPSMSSAMEGKVPEGFVTCPVCHVSVKPDIINDHLNVCLERSAKANVCLERSAKALNPRTKHPSHSKQKRPTIVQGSKIATQPVVSSWNSGKPAAGLQSTSATLGVRQRNHKAVTGADVPPRIAHTLLKDKDLRTKLKTLGLPPDGSKEDMVDRYLAYRRYVQSKVDEGTLMDLAQVRSSFLANYRQQLAAKKSNPAMGSTFLTSNNNHGPATRGTGAGVTNSNSHGNGSAPAETHRRTAAKSGVEVLELEQDGVPTTKSLSHQGGDDNLNADMTASLAADKTVNNVPSASKPVKPVQQKQAVNTQPPNSFSALIAGIKQRAIRGSPGSSPCKPSATRRQPAKPVDEPGMSSDAVGSRHIQQSDEPHHVDAHVGRPMPAVDVTVAGYSTREGSPSVPFNYYPPTNVQFAGHAHALLQQQSWGSQHRANSSDGNLNDQSLAPAQHPSMSHLHQNPHVFSLSDRQVSVGAPRQQANGTSTSGHCGNAHVNPSTNVAEQKGPLNGRQEAHQYHRHQQTQQQQQPQPQLELHLKRQYQQQQLQPQPQMQLQLQQQEQEPPRQPLCGHHHTPVTCHRSTQNASSIQRHTTPNGTTVAPTQVQATSPFTPAMLHYTPAERAGHTGTIIESVMSMYGDDDQNGDAWWEDEGDAALYDIDMD